MSTPSSDDVESKEAFQGIRWIAFDAVGTLIYPDPPAAAVYYRVAQKYGSRLSEHDVEERFSRAFRQSEDDDHGSGDADASRLTTSEARERQRWRLIVATVLDDVENIDLCFQELFEYFAQASAWRCYDDVDESLAFVKSQGFRLAIASNFDDRLNTICDSLRVLQQLDVRVISSLVGHRKPSQKFFEALISQAGCKAEEVLMIGDSYENDILGAREAGLQALCIRRNGPNAGGGSEISTLRDLTGLLS